MTLVPTYTYPPLTTIYQELVHWMCPDCSDGLMKYTGIAHLGAPVLYEHKCVSCHQSLMLAGDVYPQAKPKTTPAEQALDRHVRDRLDNTLDDLIRQKLEERLQVIVRVQPTVDHAATGRAPAEDIARAILSTFKWLIEYTISGQRLECPHCRNIHARPADTTTYEPWPERHLPSCQVAMAHAILEGQPER